MLQHRQLNDRQRRDLDKRPDRKRNTSAKAPVLSKRTRAGTTDRWTPTLATVDP